MEQPKNGNPMKRLASFKAVSKIHFSLRKGMVRQVFHYITSGHLVRTLRYDQHMKSRTIKRLQIGGGYHIKEGWLNGDLIAGDIYLNAVKKFPFRDRTFDLIFMEQFIEHISYDEGRICLLECYRVLKNGGKLRLSTPDLELIVKLYEDRNPNVSLDTAMLRHRRNHNHDLSTAGQFVNDFFRLWGHSFLYDEQTLRQHLEQAGFSNIKRTKFGQSDDRELQNLERHADVDWMKDAFQLIFETQK
jgi:predicted SAM-dependent methyltransferase